MTKSMVVKSPCNVENNVIITMDYPTSCKKINVREHEGANKNGQSRETGSIGYI